MKKLFAFLLSAVMLLGVSACGTTDKSIPSPAENPDFGVLAGVSVSPEHEAYAPGIEQITFIISNSSSAELSFGSGYSIYKSVQDTWLEVFPGAQSDDIAWDSMAYLVPTDAERALTVSVSGLDRGTYRFVKSINGTSCYAEFEVGDSPYSADSPYGYAPLSSLPSDYDSDQAEAAGDTVLGAGGIRNGDSFEHFLHMVSLGAPGGVRLTSYTVEGDPIISDIEFNGEYFKLTADSTRDSFGVQEISTFIYSYIITNDTGIYLSNCVSLEDASSCLYGLERNTVLLASGVGSDLCGMVSEIESANIGANITKMRVWTFDGESACSIDGDGFGFKTEGYSCAQSLPKESFSGLGKTVGAAWIDDSRFVIAAEISSDPVFSYVFFLYGISDGTTLKLLETFSGNGYQIDRTGLVVTG